MEIMVEYLDSNGIILIIFFIALPLLFIFKKLKSQSNPPLPPGPKSWPILGTIDHLLHNKISYLSLANLAKSYGPLLHIKLGTQHVIVGSSPAAAVEILKVNDRVLSGRYAPRVLPKTPSQIDKLSFWGDSTSPHWKNLRTVCRSELFSVKALQRSARVRAEKAAEMVAVLRSKEGLVVDVDKFVLDTVVNMSSNAYFSKDIAAVGDYNLYAPIFKGIGEIFSTANITDLYPFLGALDLQGLRRKHMKISTRMWELWKPILEERRDQLSELRHDDFLDSLISKGFGDDQINHLLEDLFSGGIHTNTIAIIKTIVELLTTPHAMAKLKLELDTAFDGQDSISDDVENLPYLGACIKETLRLHPPAPLTLGHRAYAACRVMNYTVPKDAHVLVNMWAIGRDPTAWDEPLEYRPERFLRSSSHAVDFKGNDFELLPFGAGRRICPGMSVATKIVSIVVASLVYFFDWSSAPEGTQMDQILIRATSQMKGPLLLIPNERK